MMPPRKRDKPTDKDSASDHIKTDRELFLQAFEKPTQIYRYIGSRLAKSPLLLPRCLSYRRQRMSRTHSKRKNFKVDSLLETVLSRQGGKPTGNLVITFTGYYDRHNKGLGDTVSVEAQLKKICHKKRKDVSSPVMHISVGKCDVYRNPDRNNPPAKATAISIPSDNFNLSNGHLVKSYVLVLRVYCPNGKSKVNGYCNGDMNEMLDEPASKKRRSTKSLGDEGFCYSTELVVYDKHQRCLLTDGDYEVVLKEMSQFDLQNTFISWEKFPENKEKTQMATYQEDKMLAFLNVFAKNPCVKFCLQWTDQMTDGVVDRPILPDTVTKCHTQNGFNDEEASYPMQERNKRMRIFYQFLYNNNTRQQTEARDDFHCVWCRVNCVELYCLLKHLKLCHSRFLFNYIPHPKGARIDVSINESYDGSYVGNPNDMHSTGFAFSRAGPARRNPVTHIMVCRPKRPMPSLSEFLETDEAETEGPRTYISGHNRLYYHTITCLSVRPQEIDMDSESENDPEWLRIKTQHMIDEFTDVNEGEKELMKMWNLHVMKYGFVGDCQIPLACSMFVEEHGRSILSRHLYRNFMLHMCNLYDYGLISASTVYHTMHQMNKIRDEHKNHSSWPS